jgi:phosphopantetheine--protein transferase-like protein
VSITGLGVDIVEIERMRRALERRPAMKERIFSADERAYCDARNKPEIHYAMRFAAKEAVLKALGTGFSGMRFTDVEVERDERGRPVPRLSGRAAEVAEERGIVEMHLSLSFTHTTPSPPRLPSPRKGGPGPRRYRPTPWPSSPRRSRRRAPCSTRSRWGIHQMKSEPTAPDDGGRLAGMGDAVIHALTAAGARAAEELAVAEGGIALADLMDRARARLSPGRSRGARLRGRGRCVRRGKQRR